MRRGRTTGVFEQANPLIVGCGLAGLLGCTVVKQPAAGSVGQSGAAPAAIRPEQHVALEGLLPNGAQPTNPYAGDPRSATAGEKLFTSMNCDGCHGGGATGFIAPSLSDRRWRYGGSDGTISARPRTSRD